MFYLHVQDSSILSPAPKVKASEKSGAFTLHLYCISFSFYVICKTYDKSNRGISVGSNPDIQAMIRGSMQGQQSAPGLAGNIPSAQSPGGAPPSDIDPASPAFRDAESSLTRLINILNVLHDDVNKNQVMRLAVDLSKIRFSRKKEIVDKQTDSMSSGGPMAAVPGSTAMGVPRG